MGKYIKLFETHTEYEEARQNLILPNVSYCEDNNEVHYNQIEPPRPNVAYKRSGNGLSFVVNNQGQAVVPSGGFCYINSE